LQQITINMTGRHRGPKRKLWAGCRVPSLKRTPHVAMCFHHQVWYRMLSMHYMCTWSSGIILTPTLPLRQISFLSRPPLLS